jgi:hypothetical protein
MISSIFKGISEGLVGPLFSWLNKKEDVNLEKFKVNRVVDQAALAAHVEALKSRRDVLMEAMKYRGIRFFQYAFMAPLAVWFNAVILWCIAGPYFPEIKVVWALPGNLEYVLSAIVGFLFLGSKIDEWRRKT